MLVYLERVRISLGLFETKLALVMVYSLSSSFLGL